MRRKLIALFALPASFILGICAQIVWLSWPVSGRYESERLQGTVSQDYELTGFYYPAHDFPLAFINVRRIDLTTADFRVNSDSVTRTPITPMGYLITEFDIYLVLSMPLMAKQPLETGTIRGQATDLFDSPVSGAVIEVLAETSQKRFQTKTDGHGNYELSNMPAGHLTIRINSVGFLREGAAFNSLMMKQCS